MSKKTIGCKLREACPVAKSIAWAGTVVVFTLGLYLPWLNGEVNKVSAMESKIDMILMILRGDVAEVDTHCPGDSSES